MESVVIGSTPLGRYLDGKHELFSSLLMHPLTFAQGLDSVKLTEVDSVEYLIATKDRQPGNPRFEYEKKLIVAPLQLEEDPLEGVPVDGLKTKIKHACLVCSIIFRAIGGLLMSP